MDPIAVGILHSRSGTMGASESPLIDATLLAIEEINLDGGVLQRPVRAIVEDGCSLPEVFQAKAKSLLKEEGVETLFGCWTSAARKAVKPIVERYHSLLWYPVQYEGLEQSPNIVYTGSCVNQQIEPGVRWCFSRGHRRFFLIGSDYVFPRTANRLIRGLVESLGGEILGEAYRPLGSNGFGPLVEQIAGCQPDFVFNTINGDGNTPFFEAYAASGAGAPIMSFSVSELELCGFGTAPVAPTEHYACWSYFQSLETDENRCFVEKFKDRFGPERVSSDPMVMAYAQVYLWRQAAEAAGSVDVDGVLEHVHGQTFLSPAGPIEVQPNNHVKKQVLIGRSRDDGQFSIVWRGGELVEPYPWLGIENTDLEANGLIREALGQYTEVVHLTSLLREEIGRRRYAEAELKQHREHLEELVEKRTSALAAQSEQVQEANLRLREMNRLKSEFLSNMSHELRTPLNSVLALSQLMISHGQDSIPKADIECLAVIERNGRRLLDLIDEVLDLSKLASGEVEIRSSEFPPGATLERALETIRPAALSKGVHLHTRVDDLPTIFSDEEKVRQILGNLLSNAVKFTDEGEIEVRATGSDATVTFLVRDTGLGISEEDQTQIFDEFRQVDGSSTRRFSGAGLGLAICQKLAVLLGGQITLESELGNGSTFTFILPIRSPRFRDTYEPDPSIAPIP